MPNRSPENQEIVRQLAKLKQETPDYPADLLEARKYSFLKQIVDLKISREGHPEGGTGSSAGSGGSGAASSARSTVLGMPLKTALAIGAAILMLTAAYLFRHQIVVFLAENGLINTEETTPPPFASTPDRPPQGTPPPITTPTFEAPPSGGIATESAPGPGNNDLPATPTPPAPSGPISVFQYLMCILQSGADNCR